ncbi:MAG: alanine racemase [Candidatus Cloacimonetes bacterium]|nr:alanine racemase [Candidatus Cloacimonadota bacterium]
MIEDRSWTEIDLDNFEYNLKQLTQFLPDNVSFMQIVKADAYGHGAFEIASHAIKNGAKYLGVANVEEGGLLRYQGITTPILVLSPSLVSEIPKLLEHKLTPTVSSYQFAEALNDATTDEINIHLNIDTGMGRSGFSMTDISNLETFPKTYDKLKIEGIFSHYASSENDTEFSWQQTEIFKRFLNKLSYKPKYIHIANSAAVITAKNDFCNLVRIGLLSYGIYCNEKIKKLVNLKPVMTFKTKIGQIKFAQAGDSIGYNRTFIASKDTKFAILPVGYADGYDYLLSNCGKVLVKDKICNIIGKVSMDMPAIDISEIENIAVGDEAILIGADRNEIRAENIVANYSGSAYELLCQIGRRAKRYYRNHGKIIASSPLLRRDFVSTDFSDSKLNSIIEAAMQERLQSKQVANIIYSEVLKKYFIEHDNDIHYRKNFNHTIYLEESEKFSEYYQVRTELSFNKKLRNDYITVACATTENKLEKYFMRNDVEYRWLLDENFALNEEYFRVCKVKINNLELEHKLLNNDNCIEIRCSHPDLKNLIGEEVDFSISTKTYYPKKAKQLSVYLIEMTKGVEIKLVHHGILQNVEAVPIFSGRCKFPKISSNKDSISISSEKEWVFPTSGVVFVL